MDVLKEFVQRLSQAIESMTGLGATLEVVKDSAADAGEPVVWWEQPLDLAPGATVWVGASDSQSTRLGTAVLQAAGVEGVRPEDSRTTYFEVLQQALNPMARAIGLKVGREVMCLPGRETTQSPSVSCFNIEITAAGAAALSIQAGFSEELLSGLDAALASIALQPAGLTTRSLPAPLEADGSSRTMDLLMEVELPVSISFGRAHLPLRDVLKLTSGSIVELNRGIQEPVEVIVNNCVIARGDVVVVEGNYGVRINQIVSRQERLRSLY
ncbi:MAG: flagellar motor switch protein FliN [Bryobacteraceae bacterium]